MTIIAVSATFIGIFATIYLSRYDSYFFEQQEAMLVEMYGSIDALYKNGGEVDVEMLEEAELDGVRFMLTDTEGYIEYNSLLLYTDRNPFFPNFTDDDISRFKLSELFPTASGVDAEVRIIREDSEGKYVLFSAGDQSVNAQFLGLMGLVNDERIVVIQIPTPIIETSGRHTSIFLVFAGLSSLLFAMILGYILSRTITKKVSEISAIAENMTNLDFSKRYLGDDDDDIGKLGVSINKMSEHLEVTIEELRQEIAHAKELEEMRKNLLVNVSHELKTPLAIIQGYAEGLREGVMEDESSRDFYCEVIEDESRHMTRLVGELLSVSRIEAGGTLPTPEPFMIDELIESLVTKVGVEVEKRGVELIFEPTETEIYADESMTEQVVYNYISNAIDHTADGGVVKITSEIVENMLRVSVFNEGQQIPREEHSKIWQSFYKIDKARTRAFGGTGIGLSIVKAVMEAQHTKYGVENVEGGVTFWFEAELAKEGEADDEGDGGLGNR